MFMFEQSPQPEQKENDKEAQELEQYITSLTEHAYEESSSYHGQSMSSDHITVITLQVIHELQILKPDYLNDAPQVSKAASDFACLRAKELEMNGRLVPLTELIAKALEAHN